MKAQKRKRRRNHGSLFRRLSKEDQRFITEQRKALRAGEGMPSPDEGLEDLLRSTLARKQKHSALIDDESLDD